jgi:hypothetical protein
MLVFRRWPEEAAEGYVPDSSCAAASGQLVVEQEARLMRGVEEARESLVGRNTDGEPLLGLRLRLPTLTGGKMEVLPQLAEVMCRVARWCVLDDVVLAPWSPVPVAVPRRTTP